MRTKDFNNIVKEQLYRCENLLITKMREYAEGSDTDESVDRLAAFKKAAALQNQTPIQAAFGMLAKHLVSVSDMAASGKEYSYERWNEKITDSINYLLIIRALAWESKPEKTIMLVGSPEVKAKEETK